MRLSDFEFSTDVPGMYVTPSDEPAVTIYLAAEGGGTIGEAYAGQRWHYAVLCPGRAYITGSDLRTGAAPATHAQAARVLADHLATIGESLYWTRGTDRSEHAADYAGRVRAFLESAHERMALFAHEPALLGA